MHRRREFRMGVLTALLLAGQSSLATADEMRVVTTGFISWGAPGDKDFAFAGDDFTFEGNLAAGVDPGFTHGDRAPGDVFTATNVWTGSDIVGGTGSATVDGTLISAAFVEGVFELATGPIVIPTGGADTVTVQAPFSFTENAFAAGYATSPAAAGSVPLFRFGLLGSGVATSTLAMIPGTNRYFHLNTVWTFSSQPSVVPEPGSILLLATGLAALAAVRRREKRRRE